MKVESIEKIILAKGFKPFVSDSYNLEQENDSGIRIIFDKKAGFNAGVKKITFKCYSNKSWGYIKELTTLRDLKQIISNFQLLDVN